MPAFSSAPSLTPSLPPSRRRSARSAWTSVLAGLRLEPGETNQIIPWVFHRQGTPIRDFREAWALAWAAAGLPGRLPHDFRRTAVRNLVRSGVPTPTAMEMVGHLTMSVFRRYCIVDEADMKAASRKLAAFHRDEERTGETAAAPSDGARGVPAQFPHSRRGLG